MASSFSYSFFFTNHHHHNIINRNNKKISNPSSSSSSSSCSILFIRFSSSRSRSPPPLSVCWWWWWRWRYWSSSSSSYIPSYSSLLSILSFVSTIFFSLLSFSAASDTVPTSTHTRTTNIYSPAPSPIYFSPHRPIVPIDRGRGGGGGGGGGGEGFHSSNNNNNKDTHLKLIVTLSFSALFLITCLSLIIMACFKFMIRSRRSKRVDQEADNIIDQESGSSKTQFPDRPVSLDDMELCKKKFDSNPPCFSGAKRFSWDEIQRLTMNFTSRVIGEGGFSTVYLSHFSDSSLGALKIHNNSERLNRIFKQELDVLLQVRHDNIVKFLGYCDEKEEGALVFEYVSNGSLHEKLHENGGLVGVLPWKRRMSIAFQLAQAIEYLHEKSTHQIIHGDIKSSNVLLDDELNCKLCDFGFSKMGFSSTVMPSSMSPLMGSPGYMDPNYLRSGIASKKNDVYSFGVIILELITGIEAFCSEKEMLLTSIAAPALKDSDSCVAEMVDPRLGSEFDLKEAISMASISALCLKQQPGMRPSMAEILRMMTEKISSLSSSTSDQTTTSTIVTMMKERY